MSTPLSQSRQRELLVYARACLVAAAQGQPLPPSPDEAEEAHAGAFVTLKGRDHSLRGCIGCFDGAEPLGVTVARMTRQAALHDGRFTPVGPEEVDALVIDVSVLSPRVPCPDAQAIEVGRHGVELALDGHRAVFLPQVATEQGWDRETLLDQLALKAKLPASAWRAPEARLFTFEAQVFGEGE